MGFDLSKTNVAEMSEAGYEFELRLPEVGTPVGAFIKVRGSSSEIAVKFQKRRYNERQNKETVAKRRGKEADPMTIEDLDQFTVDTAVIRTIGWRGISDKGVEIPFSKEAAEEIYAKHTWIRDAVIEASNDVANFLD